MRKRGQWKVFEKEESETIEKKEEIEPTEVESDANKELILKGEKEKTKQRQRRKDSTEIL